MKLSDSEIADLRAKSKAVADRFPACALNQKYRSIIDEGVPDWAAQLLAKLK